MNGLVAYDSSDSETEEQGDFQGHLGHLKKTESPKSHEIPLAKKSENNASLKIEKNENLDAKRAASSVFSNISRVFDIF